MLLQILLISLVIYYLTIASCLFTHWLEVMQHDARLTSKIFFSKVFLLGVTALWPIVVPLAYLELLKVKSQRLANEQASDRLLLEKL